MASNGTIQDVTRDTGDIPLGSSGIRIRFETDLVIEGIRPGRVIWVRPQSWPKMQVPREEYLFENTPRIDFPLRQSSQNIELKESLMTQFIFPRRLALWLLGVGCMASHAFARRYLPTESGSVPSIGKGACLPR